MRFERVLTVAVALVTLILGMGTGSAQTDGGTAFRAVTSAVSRHWAGYKAKDTTGLDWQGVWTTFRVPAAHCGKSETSVASIWAGIGGEGRLHSLVHMGRLGTSNRVGVVIEAFRLGQPDRSCTLRSRRILGPLVTRTTYISWRCGQQRPT
jgi:hypothetical protein